MPTLTLQRKAFLALAAMLVAMLAIFLGFSRLGLQRSLGEYVAEIEISRMDWLAERLQSHYAQVGHWEQLRSKPELWRQLRQPGDGPGGRRPPPDTLHPLPDHPHPPRPDGFHPHPDGPPPPNHHLLERPSDGGLPPPRPAPMGLSSRLGLLDVQGQLVAGQPAQEHAARLTLQGNNGATIGTLVLSPPPIGQTDADQAFLRQHLGFLAWTGVAGLALALLLSVWLARRWLGPIDALARGAQAVAAGQLDTQIAATGNDELAQLAHTFNHMAKELAGMEQSRRQWLADVAHELRTPLAAMRAEIEAVQDGIRAFDATTAQRLHRQVMRLIQLVQDLRASLDSEGGNLPASACVPVQPLSALQEALEIMRPRFDRARIAIDTQALRPLELLQPAPLVLGHAEQLHQVFLNLLENTLRYTDAGGCLQLSGQVAGSAGKRMLELQWDDTAPGVLPQELPHLFDRLFRAEASRTRDVGDLGGSGLGLAICRAIVLRHGGHISAHPSPLGGLRILLQLPLSEPTHS